MWRYVMVLKLDTNKKIDRFYRLLFFYRSFIFRGVHFECDIDDNMLSLVINALNIKKRKDRITFVYDETCKFVDEFYGGKNVCGFEDGRCYSQRCLKKDFYNGCCRKCRYQSSSGCTTVNLACKLFMCSEVKSRYEVVNDKDLKLLKLLSFKNRYVVKSDYFSTREDVLGDLYSFTFTWAGVRTLYRLIRNFVWMKRNVKDKNK